MNKDELKIELDLICRKLLTIKKELRGGSEFIPPDVLRQLSIIDTAKSMLSAFMRGL